MKEKCMKRGISKIDKTTLFVFASHAYFLAFSLKSLQPQLKANPRILRLEYLSVRRQIKSAIFELTLH